MNVTSDPLQDVLMDLVGQSVDVRDNHNTSPMSKVWIAREGSNEELEAIQAQWWLVPSWVKEPQTKYSMFNARSENLNKSNAFRRPFQSQRCVLPITGFYEWQRQDNVRQPFYLSPTDEPALYLAGLWDEWVNRETDEVLASCTVITTEVCSQLKFLHHRQPVMLTQDLVKFWISNETPKNELNDLFQPGLSCSLSVTPVSSYVNNSRNFGAQCLEAIGEPIVLDR